MIQRRDILPININMEFHLFVDVDLIGRKYFVANMHGYTITIFAFPSKYALEMYPQ